MATLAAEGGPAFGDWQLWLEVWVRARHDERIDDLRRSLDKRWRDELEHDHQIGRGASACSPAAIRTYAALRLAALMDGLAVQVVLGEPDLAPERHGRSVAGRCGPRARSRRRRLAKASALRSDDARSRRAHFRRTAPCEAPPSLG